MRRAAALVAVASLCVALGLSGCGRSTPWVLQWQAESVSLLSVSAADASHVWLVGGGPIYFFDGVSWSVQAESLEAEPTDVSAADATHAWAAGGEGVGIVFFFDGATWQKQFQTADATMSCVAAADANHVWAVGANEASANIYFFDGQAWALQYTAPIHVQDLAASTPPQQEGGQPAGAGRAWAVAEDAQGKSAVYAFDGKSWSRSYEPPGGETLFGVGASGSSDVWAVGSGGHEASSGEGTGSGGAAFLFDGEGWEKKFHVPEEMHRVAALDASHAWFSGGIGREGPIYFYDGHSLSKQFEATEALFDITAAPPDSAWAVGGLGGVFTYDPLR